MLKSAAKWTEAEDLSILKQVLGQYVCGGSVDIKSVTVENRTERGIKDRWGVLKKEVVALAPSSAGTKRPAGKSGGTPKKAKTAAKAPTPAPTSEEEEVDAQEEGA